MQTVKQITIDKTKEIYKNMEIKDRNLSAIKTLLGDNIGKGLKVTKIIDTENILQYKVSKFF